MDPQLQNEGEGYYTGSSYNPRFANAIIMQGTLYYQEPYGNSGGGGDYIAVDLQTGEELWRIDRSADVTDWRTIIRLSIRL